jgi:DNA-binding CsgD family transcriptional regulator
MRPTWILPVRCSEDALEAFYGWYIPDVAASAGARRGAVRVRAPRSLEVRRLSLEGDDLVLFSWSTDPPSRAPRLSRAEEDVLDRVLRGATNAEIARARGVSARTVANQVAGLLRKLGAASRFDLIRRCGR